MVDFIPQHAPDLQFSYCIKQSTVLGVGREFPLCSLHSQLLSYCPSAACQLWSLCPLSIPQTSRSHFHFVFEDTGSLWSVKHSISTRADLCHKTLQSEAKLIFFLPFSPKLFTWCMYPLVPPTAALQGSRGYSGKKVKPTSEIIMFLARLLA